LLKDLTNIRSLTKDIDDETTILDLIVCENVSWIGGLSFVGSSVIS